MEDFTNRIVDRIPHFDDRSRNFAAIPEGDERPFRSRTWSCDVYNDQGREGACVGFAWTHELAARPKIVRRDANFAHQIYKRAQQLDGTPGEDYSGTSVLAGVKAVMELSNSRGNAFIREYRWAFGIEDVAKVIAYKGPVVLGINWYYDMYTPDINTHFITPTGDLVGGHAIMANGVRIVKKDKALPAIWDNVDTARSWVRLHNSWGRDYGDGGDAYITIDNLDSLLRNQGEACVPTKRSFDV